MVLLVYPLETSFYYVSPSKQVYYPPLALIIDDLLLLFENGNAVLHCVENHDLASVAGYISHYSMKIAPIAAYLLRYCGETLSLEDCVLNWVDNDRNYNYFELPY